MAAFHPTPSASEGHMTNCEVIMPPFLSTIVDIVETDDQVHSPRPPTSFWSRLVKVATVVDEHLAEWFGLNQSKYQWAVDEFMDRQLTGEPQMRQTSSLTEQQMQPIGEQIMHVKFYPSLVLSNQALEKQTKLHITGDLKR